MVRRHMDLGRPFIQAALVDMRAAELEAAARRGITQVMGQAFGDF